jgi:hypothetical protein
MSSCNEACSRTTRRFFVIGRPGHDDRQPLPAGHPVSWGAITKGTVLEGTAYPAPPMTRAAPSIRFTPQGVHSHDIRNEAG